MSVFAAVARDLRKWPNNSPWGWSGLHGVAESCRIAGVTDQDLVDVIYKVYNDADRTMRPRMYAGRDRIIDSENRTEVVEAIAVFGNVLNSAIDEQDRRRAARATP